MEIISDPRVKPVFDNYPETVRGHLLHLRQLVLDSAAEIDGLHKLEETLKWGEPSYLSKHGSTLRIDWKKKSPEHYAIYFKCTSRLVPTFKILFDGLFQFEGSRAIVFKLNSRLPETEIKQCIKMALMYHRIKHLPLLGA